MMVQLMGEGGGAFAQFLSVFHSHSSHQKKNSMKNKNSNHNKGVLV